jgi:hypothetical protein
MSDLVHVVMSFLPCRPGPVFLAQRSVYSAIVLAVVIAIAHSLIFEDDLSHDICHCADFQRYIMYR